MLPKFRECGSVGIKKQVCYCLFGFYIQCVYKTAPEGYGYFIKVQIIKVF